LQTTIDSYRYYCCIHNNFLVSSLYLSRLSYYEQIDIEKEGATKEEAEASLNCSHRLGTYTLVPVILTRLGLERSILFCLRGIINEVLIS